MKCKKCKKDWPIDDFKIVYYRGSSKGYRRNVCINCINGQKKKRYYNLSIHQKQERKEKNRENAAAARRKKGVPVRNIKKKNGYGAGRVVKHSGRIGSVDPQPLLSMAKSFCWGIREIADSAKVDPRKVNDWKNGKEKMSLDAADNLCIALGTHLDLIYDI